jgi:hypothetical protein
VVTTLALLIALALFAYVALGLLQSRRRKSIGLTGSTVVAADDSHIGSPTLRSERLGLAGRPDHLVRIGGQLIPVEQKPRATRVHDSRALVMAVQRTRRHIKGRI